jgi:glycosyltransferase involved in cell wall biosynthesis
MYRYGAAFLKAFMHLEPDKKSDSFQKAQLAIDSWWDETEHERSAEQPVIRPTSHMGPVPLSINIIVRDEEQYLPRLLRSIEGLRAQELVVVDTGSTDRTVEIAREAGARVISFPWNDSFADARNVALSHSTQDWVCWFDADDELAVGGVDLVRSLAVSGTPVNYHHFRLSYGLTMSAQLRFWKRSTGNTWWPFLHERIWPNGPVQHHPEIVVHHYDDERRPAKIQRNIELLTKAIEREPINQYWRFYQMVTLAVAGRHSEALEQALVYLNLTNDADEHVGPRNYARYLVAWCSLRLEPREPKKAMELCLQGVAVSPCVAEFWCLMGDIYLYYNRPFDAYQCYDVALLVGHWNWSRFWLTDVSKYDQYPRDMKEKIRNHVGQTNFDLYMRQEKFSDVPGGRISLL